MLPAFILSGQITLAEKANLAKKELGSTEDFFAYCPTQGGVKPPPLGGGFSVSFVVCGHEQLS